MTHPPSAPLTREQVLELGGVIEKSHLTLEAHKALKTIFLVMGDLRTQLAELDLRANKAENQATDAAEAIGHYQGELHALQQQLAAIEAVCEGEDPVAVITGLNACLDEARSELSAIIRLEEWNRRLQDALRPFTFRACPESFLGEDSNVSPALICDSDVQRARRTMLLSFASLTPEQIALGTQIAEKHGLAQQAGGEE